MKLSIVGLATARKNAHKIHILATKSKSVRSRYIQELCTVFTDLWSNWLLVIRIIYVGKLGTHLD